MSSWARNDGGGSHFETKIGSWREVGEERFRQFLLVARLERLGLGDICRASGRRGGETDRVFVVEFEVDEELRIGHPKREELGDGRWRLQRQGDMEFDQMVGPLLHPVV